jgi:hypothetical protein
MTQKYDISQTGRSWCLNDRLDPAITPVHPILAKKMFKNKKMEKRVNKKFPL